MKNTIHTLTRQKGLTLIELMVAMAISLVIVVAAAYVYLASRESQRSIDRNSSSQEVGAFVLQMLGREIMNAGFYPATMSPIPVDSTQQGMYDTYPPLPTSPTSVITDWQKPATGWPPAAFLSPIFGCASGLFDVEHSTCPPPDVTLPDTIVINSFTSDTAAMGDTTGRRMDCTGSDVADFPAGGDPSNNERKKNTGGSPPTTPHTGIDENLPPQLPVFVSNRFALKETKVAVENGDVTTSSLACSGNGSSWHGTANAAAYQPIMQGVEDLRFTYGVYTGDATYTPARFYTATEVNGLANETINGVNLTPWQRVTAVRVCVLTRTLGGNTRIADKAGSPRTYLDCSGTAKSQPRGDTISRHVEVFGLRNALKQYY